MKTKINILIVVSMLLFSCSKDSNHLNQDTTIPKGYVGVIFTPAVEPEDDLSISSDNIDKNKATLEPLNSTTPNDKVELFEGDGLDARITMKEPAPVKIVSNQKTVLKASNIADVPTSLMAVGVKYTVIIYNMDDEYITHKELTVDRGSTSTNSNTIVLRGGNSYKYKAVSYNTTTSPPITDVSGSEPSITSDNNQLIYASGTISSLPFNTSAPDAPSNNPNITKVGIVFQNQTAKLTFKYSFRGLQTFNAGGGYANPFEFTISSSSTEDINPFKTGTFDIKTGTYKAHANYASAFYLNRIGGETSPIDSYIKNWYFLDQHENWKNFNDEGTAIIYSSTNATIPQLHMRIKKLEYQRGHINPPYETLAATAASPVVLTFGQPINLEIGKNMQIKYELIEPAVTVDGINEPGITPSVPIKFARGNVAHRGWGTHGDTYLLKQYPLNALARNYGNYTRFRFNEKHPEYFTTHEFTDGTPERSSYLSYTSRTVGDPCALVYPLGAWKSPSVAQLQAVADYINAHKNEVEVPDNSTHQTHVVFPASSTASTSKLSSITHNRLILERSGYGAYSESASMSQKYSNTNIDTSPTGSSTAYYWSDESHKYLSIYGVGTSLNAVVSTAGNVNNTLFIRCVRVLP